MLLYGVGLIAPLTPSEGMPRLWEILVFGVVPVALLVACLRASRGGGAGIFILMQIVVVVAFTGWLLWIQA
jgi:hypothetical protein